MKIKPSEKGLDGGDWILIKRGKEYLRRTIVTKQKDEPKNAD